MAYPKDINKLKKKLDLYNGIVKSSATNTFALQKRMEARFLLGDKEGALEDFTKLILLDPKNKDLKNHPFNPHRPDAEPIDPKYGDFFLALGLLKMKSKSYEEALDAYEQAILIGEGNDSLLAIAYREASLCASKIGDFEKSYTYATQTLDFSVVQQDQVLKELMVYVQAITYIGSMSSKETVFEPQSIAYKKLERSIHVVILEIKNKENLSDDDGLAENYTFLAIAYKRIGKFQLALEAINKTIGYRPQLAEAYLFRAVMFLKEGFNEEQAYQDLRTAFNLNSQLLQGILPDLNLENELTNEEKEQLINSNIPMQPAMKILDDDLDLGGVR